MSKNNDELLEQHRIKNNSEKNHKNKKLANIETDEELTKKIHKKNDDKKINNVIIPVLPLREQVIFPGMVLPIYVGREKSKNAVLSSGYDKELLIVSQLNKEIDDPEISDLNITGVICNIIHIRELEDKTLEILLEGKKRVEILKLVDQISYNSALIKNFDNPLYDEQRIKIITKKIEESFKKLKESIPHLNENMVENHS